MKRLWLVLIAGAAIELSRGSFAPQLQALPVAPAGWTRVAQTTLDSMPRGIESWPGSSRADKAWKATYNGTPPIELSLYAMPWSPASAWDAIQKWRPTPGRMAFAKGRYFGVAESPGADPATLRRFVQGVMTTLPQGAETVR